MQSADYELWTGAMQRAEVVFVMHTDEKDLTYQLLSQFKTAPVDQAIVDRGGELYRKWHPSHGIDVKDAILAATVIETGGQVFCLKTKHYPMPGVPARKAW